MDELKLNVSLLRRRVPNLTSAAKSVGLRAATVSNLCTGKIPVGRAEVRTLAALASLAECTIDELLIKGEGTEILETGIKVLDVFAPVARGGIVGLVARPGMGQLVLLSEIFLRMGKRDATTIFILPEDKGPGIEDVIENTQLVCSSKEEVYNQLNAIDKKSDILLAVDRSIVLDGEIFSFQDSLKETGVTALTTFIVDPRGEAVDEEEPFGPLDTLWQFDSELISRSIYPAVNPVYSNSTILEGGYVDSNHMTIQQKAKKVIRRYRELRFLVDAFGKDRISENDLLLYTRGERLEAYLSQPFYCAEDFTKKPGVFVPLQQSLSDIQSMINGSFDHADVNDFRYIGSIGDMNP